MTSTNTVSNMAQVIIDEMIAFNESGFVFTADETGLDDVFATVSLNNTQQKEWNLYLDSFHRLVVMRRDHQREGQQYFSQKYP